MEVPYWWNETSGMFVVYADSPYAAGDEVMVSYGRQNNTALLDSYGFVLPGNPHEQLDLDLGRDLDANHLYRQMHTAMHALHNIGVAPGDAMLSGRLRLLERVDVEAAEDAAAWGRANTAATMLPALQETQQGGGRSNGSSGAWEDGNGARGDAMDVSRLLFPGVSAASLARGRVHAMSVEDFQSLRLVARRYWPAAPPLVGVARLLLRGWPLPPAREARVMLAVATAAEAHVRADVLWLEEDEDEEEEEKEEDEATLAEADGGKNARRTRAHATRRRTRSTTRRRYRRSRRTDGSAGAGVALMEGVEALRRMVDRREGSAVAQQLAAYRIERHRSLHVIIVHALGRMGDAYLSMDGVVGSERSEWEGRLYRWRLQWGSWRGRLACGDVAAEVA